jgi:hypothetical protein
MRTDDPILKRAQQELSKHIWDNFVEGDVRSIADGGKGVVSVGCAGCELSLQTRGQYMRHLCEDVLPAIVDDVIERVGIEQDS